MKSKTLALAALLALPAGTMHAEGLFKKVYSIVAAALLMTMPEAQAAVAGQLIPERNLLYVHNSFSFSSQDHLIKAADFKQTMGTIKRRPHKNKLGRSSRGFPTTTIETNPECHTKENGEVECCRDKIVRYKVIEIKNRVTSYFNRYKKLCATMTQPEEELLSNDYIESCLLQALDDPEFADVIAYFNDEDE